ncbi:hypothetical protein BO71DRAFT_425754 [Aspergillus ellipticus CBS 707.79]|uniref:Uncharacterized protein n=1 Tax=Aspergillus ellipticus CBS 707.79 TaxID=1448320 RepID=A0A319F212_9EURO|nr:hypothetical protein BO71DRAFT_425754 [Aspergillus ellipticus CBS 707.79]
MPLRRGLSRNGIFLALGGCNCIVPANGPPKVDASNNFNDTCRPSSPDEMIALVEVVTSHHGLLIAWCELYLHSAYWQSTLVGETIYSGMRGEIWIRPEIGSRRGLNSEQAVRTPGAWMLEGVGD